MSDTTESKPESETPAVDPAATATDAQAPEATADASGSAQIETLRKERDDNYNHYLRALADLENYRRRVVREKDEIRQYSTRDLVESIIPVFEGLGLAVKSAAGATDPQVIAQGVTMVLEQFRGVLASKGLVEVNPEPGAEFDPHQHESIAHGPSETVPEEKVLQVVRTGFSLNGRLIRPASVVLSSGPTKE